MCVCVFDVDVEPCQTWQHETFASRSTTTDEDA